MGPVGWLAVGLGAVWVGVLGLLFAAWRVWRREEQVVARARRLPVFPEGASPLPGAARAACEAARRGRRR